MRRRHLLLGLALPLASPALAQDLPRTIRVLVPFAAGASSDTLARLVTAKLAEALGVNFVIENRAGAGGLIAAQTVPPRHRTVRRCSGAAAPRSPMP